MPKINQFLLRRLREKKGWSQEQLAAAAKVSVQTISRIERGEQLENHGRTIQAIARVLGHSEHVLTGEIALPAPQGNYDVTLSRMDIEVSTLARNALYLVGERYFVPHSTIVELAPFLFSWAAEASLRRRKRLLEHATASALSEEEFTEESEAIDRRDLFGDDLVNNPFETFLCDLTGDMDDDAILSAFDPFDYPTYRICVDDAVLLAGGDSKVADEILSGHVPLHEMPKELWQVEKWDARTEWVRAKAEEYREEILRRILRSRECEKEAQS